MVDNPLENGNSGVSCETSNLRRGDGISISNTIQIQAQIGVGPNRPPNGKSGILFGGPAATGPGLRGNPLRGFPGRPNYVVPLGFPIFPFNSLGWVGVW